MSRPLLSLLSVLVGAVLLVGCDGSGSSNEGGSTIFPPPEPEVQSFPRWSPDGDRILYYDHGRQDPDRRVLWTMRRGGTDLRQITDPPRNPLN